MSQQNNPGDDGSPEEFLKKIFESAGFGVSGGSFSEILDQIAKSFEQAASSTPDDVEDVNWNAMKMAINRVVSQSGPDPSVDYQTQRALGEADRLAQQWLDEVTAMTPPANPAKAMSRSDWVESTMPAWRKIVSPIVTALADAMGKMLGSGNEFGDDQLTQLNKLMAPLLRNAAASMYAMQLSQAIGNLATSTLSGSEIGLQLLEKPQVALIPTNIGEFSEGLENSPEDILIYLTVREAARQRLFSSVGWLGPQLLTMLEHYAREIQIDSSALTQEFDPQDLETMNPEKLAEIGERMQGRLFSPTKTPEQEEILGRLETLLALIEGWVDEITSRATTPWMQETANQLSETIKRRRVTNDPSSEAFSNLVGMEISPRRIRDAANLWAALTEKRGAEKRDQTWSHPDLIPTAEDLDDPIGYANGEHSSSTDDELDEALRKILDDSENN